MPTTMFLAEMESEHFSWRAIGKTEAQARAALVKVWDAHVEQIADDDCGYADIISGREAVDQYGANITAMIVGEGYRDGSTVLDTSNT